MCSVMVVCVLLSRFSLVAALGDRRELLAGPIALAPEAGRQQGGGEGSAGGGGAGGGARGGPQAGGGGGVGGRGGAGRGRGVARGGGARTLSEIRLVPPDPDGVHALWREVLERLERIGASVESDRPGEAYFDADGLHG